MCRSLATGCASAATMCSRKWWRGLEQSSYRSRRHSIRSLHRHQATIIITDPIMATDDTERGSLYRLMAWLSPSYPVGAFSYSSGIEWAVEAGDITDAESLR